MNRLSASLRRVTTAPLLALIWCYQHLISPLTPPTCRFYPSCSTYAATALRRHGLVRGTWLSVRRLLRCNPWNPGGVDHVPQGKGDRQSVSDDPEHTARPQPTAVPSP